MPARISGHQLETISSSGEGQEAEFQVGTQAQLLLDYGQEPPAHRALNCSPVPAAVFGSSPHHIHRGLQPFAITQTCQRLATRTGTHYNTVMEKQRLTLKLSGLHACPKGGHQRDTHIPLKPILSDGFFPYWTVVMAISSPISSQMLPKTAGKTIGTAKRHHNCQDTCTRQANMSRSRQLSYHRKQQSIFKSI